MARLSKTEWIEQQKARKLQMEQDLGNFLTEALETKDGIDKLTAHYRISGLYNYSFYNSLLIMLQGGTVAQSYNKWKRMGRTVIKGQKSHIEVFVPIIKRTVEADGTEDSRLVGFKLGKVFNIDQTEGKELEYDHNSTEACTVDYEAVKGVLGDLAGADVVEKYTGTARGWSDGKELTVSAMSNDADKIKTLTHEVAHHILHTGNGKEAKVSHATAEVEAESIAYLVMSYVGMDFELSKAYVKSWDAGIKDARTGLIVKTADKIIKALRKAGE